jgi:hypothetical protein
MIPTEKKIFIIPSREDWEACIVCDGKIESVSSIVNPIDFKLEKELISTLFFSLNHVVSIPFEVHSHDLDVWNKVALLHAEQIGLFHHQSPYRLMQIIEIDSINEKCLLNAVFIHTQNSEYYRIRTNYFDISAKLYSHDCSCITIWKEFSCWVFSFQCHNKIIYFKSTHNKSDNIDSNLIREIRLSIDLLRNKKIDFTPTDAFIHAKNDYNSFELSHFENSIQVKCEVVKEVILSNQLENIDYVPEYVIQENINVQKKKKIKVILAASLFIYIMSMIYLFIREMMINNEFERNQEYIKSHLELENHIIDYRNLRDQINDLVDLDKSPLEIIHQIHTCFPAKSPIRIEIAEIDYQSIKLIGESKELEAINTFSLNLSKNEIIGHYNWQIPQPNQGKGGWQFSIISSKNENE